MLGRRSLSGSLPQTTDASSCPLPTPLARASSAPRLGSPSPSSDASTPRCSPVLTAALLAPHAPASAPAYDLHAPYETLSEAWPHQVRGALLRLEARLTATPPLERTQSEVTPSHRRVLVNWLVGLSHGVQELRVERETLGLAVAYMDRMLSRRVIPLGALQLLGGTAYFVAAKMEEVSWVVAADLIEAAGSTFSQAQLLTSEGRLVETLEYRLSEMPVAAQWAPLLLRQAGLTRDACGSHTPTLILAFWLDAALYEYELAGALPSALAAAGLHLTREVLMLEPAAASFTPHTSSALVPFIKALKRAARELLSPAENGEMAGQALHAAYATYSDRAGKSILSLLQRFLGVEDLAHRRSKRGGT